MRSAFQIAPSLIALARDFGCSITPLKLQKLLYYSQAWSLVFRGKPLFYENIEAWIHGPVVPPVYRHYKQYRYSVIPDETPLHLLYDSEISILNLVLNRYGRKSAKFLEDLTHSEDPWLASRRGLSAQELSNRKIPLKAMRDYYTQFVENQSPPQIKPTALEQRDGSFTKHKTMNNVLAGMSSSLDIFPSSSVHTFFTPDDFSSPEADFEALSSDWEKVGGYIQATIDIVENLSSDYE